MGWRYGVLTARKFLLLLLWAAVTEPLQASDIEELMVSAVEKRFGASLRAPREIQWLTDRGSVLQTFSSPYQLFFA